ncbi:hypothetical protein JCM19239_6826 [Vibrio variabilis]|uniref:Uncharacterized protein n=1 Tax=Vibrio variabilis TaxID=990271 RepID=A0ABQ0JN68_9VIBR|nr:hypothetical protein JCM19239_6826 [Vibrio variabilis]
MPPLNALEQHNEIKEANDGVCVHGHEHTRGNYTGALRCSIAKYIIHLRRCVCDSRPFNFTLQRMI